jgi:hypothetical protein
MKTAEAILYNSVSSLPYHEQLEALKRDWGIKAEDEIFDKIRGIGRWVEFRDGSILFIPRIPRDLLQTITIGKDIYGFYNFEEQSCRDLITREGL